MVRNWGRVPIFIGRVPKQKLGRLSTFFYKREGPSHRKTEEEKGVMKEKSKGVKESKKAPQKSLKEKRKMKKEKKNR